MIFNALMILVLSIIVWMIVEFIQVKTLKNIKHKLLLGLVLAIGLYLSEFGCAVLKRLLMPHLYDWGATNLIDLIIFILVGYILFNNRYKNIEEVTVKEFSKIIAISTVAVWIYFIMDIMGLGIFRIMNNRAI